MKILACFILQPPPVGVDSAEKSGSGVVGAELSDAGLRALADFQRFRCGEMTQNLC